MTLPKSAYKDPSDIIQSREFFSLGCGACALHRPNQDRTEFHCIAECRLWPDATNATCALFKKRVKEKRT